MAHGPGPEHPDQITILPYRGYGTGTRIVLHLLKTLKRTGKKRGMAAICIGGGLGGAMLAEAL